jgi:hypothetical protein
MGQKSHLPRPKVDSWPRVIVNTIALEARRLRLRRGDGPRRRLGIPLAVVLGLVMVGAGVLALGWGGREEPGNTATVPFTATQPETGTATTTSSDQPSRASSRIPSLHAPTTDSAASRARAAAGAEIARRSDIDVSPAAAAVLRGGHVDGRVLMVLASLATLGQLIAVDVSDGVEAETPVEMGVVSVDSVLDWLEAQPQLRPDHTQARRESSITYLLLAYDTPEPPGLFPS